MSAPLYGDLGKNARDVFGKGYHFGLLKLDTKTKSTSGVEFSCGGSSNLDSGKVSGSLETKCGLKEWGLTLTEKWNTDNTLATEVSAQDCLRKGLKISLDSTFAPQTGKLTVRNKTEFKGSWFAGNSEIDTVSNILDAAVVLAHQGWFVGYKGAFDIPKSTFTNHNVSVSRSSKDYVIHAFAHDNLKDIGFSLYNKTNNPNLDVGVMVGFDRSQSEHVTRLNLGCKLDLDDDSSVRAKVNNNGQVGLGYQQKIREGVTITLSTLIDGKNFNNGGHKVGLALDFQA